MNNDKPPDLYDAVMLICGQLIAVKQEIETINAKLLAFQEFLLTLPETE